MGIGELAIIMVFAIPLSAVIGGLAVEALKVLRKGADADTKKRLQEETEQVQLIFQRLERMEERLEALETILIERDREWKFDAVRYADTSGPSGRAAEGEQ